MSLNFFVLHLAQRIQSPVLTSFSRVVDAAANPILLLFISVIISVILFFKKEKFKAFFLFSTVVLTAAIIEFLKNIFKIVRPASALIVKTDYAFPSGHVVFSVVFFGMVVYLLVKDKYKILATVLSVFLVLIISFTRLYLRVHWATDVYGGIIIGVIILVSAIMLYRCKKGN